MGFFDTAKSALDRGTAAAERTTRTTRLKMQLSDIASKRKELAAQLGASLYEVAREDPALREGREGVIDAISALDEQRAVVEAEIASIEAQALEAQDAAAIYTCPQCGARVTGRQSFCSGCGLAIAEIKKVASVSDSSSTVASGIRCANCGEEMRESDLFCMNCGTKREPDEPEEAEVEVEVEVMPDRE